jgi:hypothetical protein
LFPSLFQIRSCSSAKRRTGGGTNCGTALSAHQRPSYGAKRGSTAGTLPNFTCTSGKKHNRRRNHH